jgi:diguanylate cyclase (GGDEF)-like protein
LNFAESNLLIIMELKGFKQTNDTLGRSSGDAILTLVGGRLEELTKAQERATAYRLEGPEYCLLIQDFEGESTDVTQSLHECMRAPLEIDGLHLIMQPVMGVAQTPDHSKDGKGLLRSADIALGWAKKSKEESCLYESGKDNLGLDNLALLADLRTAIERDELMLYFQPQFDLLSGQMMSCEALLRWRHEDFGFIEPERFIGVAESGDLIRALTFWVARHTVSQISIFKLMDISVPTSINISNMDIVDTDFPAQIKALLEEFAVEPENLRMEVTEATLMSDPDRSIKIISELGEIGVKLDIDDFGTGYSCIAGIRQLPLATIKIDECFISDVVTNKRHQAIVRSIIGMAHGLGVEVVAEGVENEETVELLKLLGCDMGQGFHFARPVPAADFLIRAPAWL